MMNRLGFENRVGRVPATYGFDVGRGGNGYVLPLIARTDYSFDGRAGSLDQDVPIAVGIDSSSFVSGVILVRLHARNTWLAGSSLTVVVQNIMLVPEEPDVIFFSPTNLATTPPQITNATTIGTLLVSSLGTMGPMLRVLLRYNQGASGASGSQTVSLGVDLVGRPA